MVPASIYTFIYMNINNCYCVIMAGGAGSRFWPISKTSKPKQFLKAGNKGKTLIRLTYERCLKIVPEENILVVTSDKYHDLVVEQIPELERRNLLLEPYRRNTAPCIAYATYTLISRNPEASMVVMPSDHIIDNDEAFATTIKNAFEHIQANDVLMTLGIIPTRPDTNYGYVQTYGGREAYRSNEPLQIKTFTEKPNKELAKVFISTGEFLWNAGTFVWKARVIKEEMEKHLPEVTTQFEGWKSAIGTPIESAFIQRAYTDCPNVSIAYSVMERTDRAWIYPAHFGWKDIGTWESLYTYIPKDSSENAVSANKSLIDNTSGSLIVSQSAKKLIAIKGLEDFMVIDTPDALVICPKDDKTFKDFISGIAMPGYEEYR